MVVIERAANGWYLENHGTGEKRVFRSDELTAMLQQIADWCAA